MEKVSSIIEFLVTSVFSEIFAIYFLIGFAIFAAGLLILILFALSRSLGYRTTGRVIGAVELKRIKRKERDGKVIEKHKTMLYPVFQYTTKSGVEREMRSSDGGTSTLSYTTGQAVNLIVREDADYDDVYDADQKSALFVGLGIAGFGLLMMSWVGTAIAAIGISLSTIVLLLLAYALRELVQKYTDNGSPEQDSTKKKREPYSKAFDRSELHPIEHFKAPR